MSALQENEVTSEVLSFRLGGRQFAVNLAHVREIVRLPRITRVPLAPAYVLGVFNLRGQIITAISGCARMGQPASATTGQSRVLILTIKSVTLGFVVDEVDRILRFAPDQLDTSPKAAGSLAEEFLAGVLKESGRSIFKLAAARLLDLEEAPAPASAHSISVPRPASKPVSDPMRTVVIAEIGSEEFGIPIELVREVVRFAEPNPIPDSPAFLLGVTLLRSQVLPVIELRTLMQRPSLLEEVRLQAVPVRAMFENARAAAPERGAALLEKCARLIERSPALRPLAKKLLDSTAALCGELHRAAALDGGARFGDLFALLEAIELAAIEAANRRVLIVETQGARFGLAVDGVTQIVTFRASSLQAPPPIANESGVQLGGLVQLEGAGRLVLLLQLEEIINKNRLTGLPDAGAAPASPMLASNQQQWVSFITGGEVFALPIGEVFEIGRVETITRIPSTPKFIQGVINLRGEVVPIIDLRKRFGLEAIAGSDRARIIYFRTADTKVGLLVDGVSQIITLAEADIAEPPQGICASRVAEYLIGIAHPGDRMVLLLDSAKLLTKAEQEGAEKTSRQGTARLPGEIPAP